MLGLLGKTIDLKMKNKVPTMYRKQMMNMKQKNTDKITTKNRR